MYYEKNSFIEHVHPLGTIDTTRNVVVPTIRAPDACRRTNGSKKKKIMSHSEKNWEQR